MFSNVTHTCIFQDQEPRTWSRTQCLAVLPCKLRRNFSGLPKGFSLFPGYTLLSEWELVLIAYMLESGMLRAWLQKFIQCSNCIWSESSFKTVRNHIWNKFCWKFSSISDCNPSSTRVVFVYFKYYCRIGQKCKWNRASKTLPVLWSEEAGSSFLLYFVTISPKHMIYMINLHWSWRLQNSNDPVKETIWIQK